jgi:hypothetical protein
MACARPQVEQAVIPEWTVGSTPTLTIGTTEADPGHELAQVSGARMRDGQVLVANSGSYEIRRFDSAGRYLGATGRKGQGPGEFLGVISLFPASGDSVYTLDAGNLRWSLHDRSGRFVRVIPGGPAALPRPTWLHRRLLVESNAPEPAPNWTLVLLDSLSESPPGAPARRARFDDLGYLWLQDSILPHAWTVFADTAKAVGRVMLPAGFEMMQAGRGFVLGVERDSIDQEIVRAYSLARPDGLVPPSVSPAATHPADDPAARKKMLADMNGILMAQEVFYGSHATYTANADSLGATISSGFELVLLAGDKRHWAGVLYDRVSRQTCGLSVGFPAPPGWLDGSPFCGR